MPVRRNPIQRVADPDPGRPASSMSGCARIGLKPWLLILVLSLVTGLWPTRALAAESGFDLRHTAWTRLLNRHVDQGWVDYPGLVREKAPLDAYLDQLGAVTRSEFDGWSREDRIAFLINLYNAATLRLVRDHYPVTSIRKIGGLFSSPWKLPVVRVWGSMTTLDDIEHIHLRRDLPEPRIHFALVCAARSCPALRPTAWTGATLEADLEVEARRFLRDPTRNRLDRGEGILHLSAIFDWFGGDFTTGGRNLPEVVGVWMEERDREYLAGKPVKVRFNDYDWTLNGPRPANKADAAGKGP